MMSLQNQSREENDPNYRPLLDNRPSFIETKSESAGPRLALPGRCASRPLSRYLQPKLGNRLDRSAAVPDLTG